MKIKTENSGQISAEMILLLGILITISLICGNYIFKINSTINNEFSNTMNEGRDFLLNKI